MHVVMRRWTFGVRLGLLLVFVGAILSILGGGLLVLERFGIVTLRRVPNVTLVRFMACPARVCGDTTGDRRLTVAVINTDVVGASFLLAPFDCSAGKNATRLWVPPRSVVLRRIAEGVTPDTMLFHGRLDLDQTGCPKESSPCYVTKTTETLYDAKLVLREREVRVDWQPSRPRPAGEDRQRFCVFGITRRAGISLVPRPGLQVLTRLSQEQRKRFFGEIRSRLGVACRGFDPWVQQFDHLSLQEFDEDWPCDLAAWDEPPVPTTLEIATEDVEQGFCILVVGEDVAVDEQVKLVDELDLRRRVLLMYDAGMSINDERIAAK